MTTEASIYRTLALAIQNAPTDVNLPLIPARAPKAVRPSTAVRRCRKAWERAYDQYMRENDGVPANTVFARREGHAAFRKAIPILAGRHSVESFLACTAYGVLIGAVNREQSTQLLSAARIAAHPLLRERKTATEPAKAAKAKKKNRNDCTPPPPAGLDISSTESNT